MEQVVGSERDDQQVGVIWESRSGRGDLPAILPQVADGPAGFLGQDIHPPAVRIVALTQIGAWIVALGVGIAKANNIHPAHAFRRYYSTNAHGSIAQTFVKRSTVYPPV